MKQVFLIFAFSFMSFGAFAQRLSPIVQVSKLKHFANEPTIAINPTDTAKIIIATNTKHIYTSTNHTKFKHKKAKSPLGVYGDPVLLYNQQGTCYYVHLAKGEGKKWPECFDQIVVQETSNHGKKWSSGMGIGKNGKMHDKAWISMDENKQSPYYGNIYISWTEFDKYGSKEHKDSSRILCSFYKKGNPSFSTPVKVNQQNGNCIDSDSTVEGATTCMDKNGNVYMAWAGFEKLFFAKSTDGSKTWSQHSTIAHTPKGWDLEVPNFYRTNGLPFINIDNQDNLFVCTAFEENGKNKIALFESDNKGNTWHENHFYNLDTQAHYIMPHAYCDKTTGNYFILYYEVKQLWVHVKLSYKKQSEEKFNTITITEKPFNVPSKYVFFGDYIGVCAVDNKVAMTWTEPKSIATVVKTRNLYLE